MVTQTIIMVEHKLHLNVSKTKLIAFKARNKLDDSELQFTFENNVN